MSFKQSIGKLCMYMIIYTFTTTGHESKSHFYLISDWLNNASRFLLRISKLILRIQAFFCLTMPNVPTLFHLASAMSFAICNHESRFFRQISPIFYKISPTYWLMSTSLLHAGPEVTQNIPLIKFLQTCVLAQ